MIIHFRYQRCVAASKCCRLGYGGPHARGPPRGRTTRTGRYRSTVCVRFPSAPVGRGEPSTGMGPPKMRGGLPVPPTGLRWAGARQTTGQPHDSDGPVPVHGVRAFPIGPGREGRGEPSMGLLVPKITRSGITSPFSRGRRRRRAVTRRQGLRSREGGWPGNGVLSRPRSCPAQRPSPSQRRASAWPARAMVLVHGCSASGNPAEGDERCA